jgi:selenocysteine-specific elongation factor
VRTIGGGEILNPVPVKHKRNRPEVIESLTGLRDEDPEKIVVLQTREAGYPGVSFSALKVMTNTTDKQLDGILQQLLSSRQIVLVDRDNRVYVHQEKVEALKKQSLDYIENYHRSNPLKSGLPREELKSKLPPVVGVKLFNLLLNAMIKDGDIAQEEETVRLSSHEVSLGEDQTAVRDSLLDIYRQSGLTPPNFKDLPEELNATPAGVKEVLMLLVKEGKVVKVNEELYFDAGSIERLKDRLVAYLREKGEISTPDFKTMTGASRKYVIPLIEYFDSRNVTIRIGDIRKLRSG